MINNQIWRPNNTFGNKEYDVNDKDKVLIMPRTKTKKQD